MERYDKVKCSKVRKCKWKGLFAEMKDVLVDGPFENMTEKVCPNCGHNEFYEVDE